MIKYAIIIIMLASPLNALYTSSHTAIGMMIEEIKPTNNIHLHLIGHVLADYVGEYAIGAKQNDYEASFLLTQLLIGFINNKPDKVVKGLFWSNLPDIIDKAVIDGGNGGIFHNSKPATSLNKDQTISIGIMLLMASWIVMQEDTDFQAVILPEQIKISYIF